MKKVLSLILVTMLVFATLVTPVGADSHFKKSNNNKYEEKYTKELNVLKNQLKNNKKYNDQISKIMKEMDKLKQKYKGKYDFDFDDFDADDLWILINGEEFSGKDTSVIKYGNFLLPVKPITEGLKAELKYDDKEHIVTITKDDKEIVIDLEKKKITINDEKIDWKIIDGNKKKGRIVLVKAIATILGLNVDCDDDSGVIIIDEKYTSFNDNDSRFEYMGNWTYLQKQNGAYMEDLHFSNEKDASMKIGFTGTEIKLYGSKGPDKGYGIVKVNGKEQYVNFYSYKAQNNVLLYTSSKLNEGSYTLEVKVSGNKSFMSKGNGIAIDRVDVLGEETDEWNVALNKTASSDTYQGGNDPQKANDGNTATRWCAADENANHWWKVDLGGYYNIKGTEITWELDEKIYEYKVETSTNGSEWNLVLDKTNNSSKKQVQNENISSTIARYVKITITGLDSGAWASISEAKIFGSPVTINESKVPGVPVSLNAKTVSTSQIAVNWKAPATSTAYSVISGYKIYRDGKHIGTLTSPNSLTYQDSGLLPGKTYEYTVRSFNSNNVESKSSTAIKAATFGNGSGLKAEYYENKDFTLQKLVRTDKLVNFTWGFNSPDTDISGYNYSVRWSGEVQPLYSDKYDFLIKSDGGIRVWVNGEKLIDDWTKHTISEKSASIDLIAGEKYDIKVEYFNDNSTSQVILSWSSNMQTKEVIPQRQFYLE